MLDANFLFEGAGDLNALLDLDIGVCCYRLLGKGGWVGEGSSLWEDSVVDTICVVSIFLNIVW